MRALRKLQIYHYRETFWDGLDETFGDGLDLFHF